MYLHAIEYFLHCQPRYSLNKVFPRRNPEKKEINQALEYKRVNP